jgi:carboxypeptidase C (cathepsin A)
VAPIAGVEPRDETRDAGRDAARRQRVTRRGGREMSRALVALSAALALSARRVDANDVVDDAARTRDALTSRLTTKTVRLERFATDLESLAANDYDEYAASSGYFALNRTTKDAHMFYTFFDARSGGAESEDAIPIILWLTGGPGCSSELAACVSSSSARARAIFRVLNDTGEGRDTD